MATRARRPARRVRDDHRTPAIGVRYHSGGSTGFCTPPRREKVSTGSWRIRSAYSREHAQNVDCRRADSGDTDISAEVNPPRRNAADSACSSASLAMVSKGSATRLR